MSAGKRGWIWMIALSAFCSLTATTRPATAEETDFALASEIESKFPESAAAVDDAGILESALLFTQTFQASKEGMLGPGVRMDHPPLPWRAPTFVETVIEDGFPSGRETKPAPQAPGRDDSYLLAAATFNSITLEFTR